MSVDSGNITPMTRTIKIRLSTYQALKILAAERGEKLMDLVDRLVKEAAEQKKQPVVKRSE